MIRKDNLTLDKHFFIIFIFFLLLQPVIDVFTSLMAKGDSSITLGLVIRVIMLVVILYYALFVVSSKYKKHLIIYFVILGIYAVIYIVNAYLTKGSTFLLAEIKAFVKLIYYPVMLASMFCIFESKELYITPEQTARPGIVYSILILAAIITGTSFLSYGPGIHGTAGWYYAPNEIGAILTVLFPLLYFSLLRHYKSWPFYVVLPIYIVVCLWIGTKAPMLGMMFTLGAAALVYLIKLIFCGQKLRSVIVCVSSVLIALLIFLLLPLTPCGKNLNMHLKRTNVQGLADFFNIEDESKEEDEVKENDGDKKKSKKKDAANVIFSSRDKYLAKVAKDYSDDSTLTKFIGKGFVMDDLSTEEIEYVSVEMDFFDVFFRLGIIGTVIYMTPMIALIVILLVSFFKKPLAFFDDEPFGLILALLLSVCLAAIAGHVITAPAVSTYVVVLFVSLYVYQKKKIHCNIPKECPSADTKS